MLFFRALDRTRFAMSHPSLVTHHAAPRAMTGLRAAPLCAAVVLAAACTGVGVGPETPLSYRILEGACGDVLFVESIGTDSASALAEVEARKAEWFGDGEVVVAPYALEVVDEHGNPPSARFYALEVLDADTGTRLHSVSEVITTDGDLFHIDWCPD